MYLRVLRVREGRRIQVSVSVVLNYVVSKVRDDGLTKSLGLSDGL